MMRNLAKILSLGVAVSVWGFGYSVEHGILYMLLIIFGWELLEDRYK